MSFPAFHSLYHRLLFILPFVADFNYDNPHQWPNEFPTCVGIRQSPIDIYTYKTIPVNFPPLEFQLYDDPLNDLLTLRNNGHTIEFDVPETIYGSKPFITGGLLQDIYTAEAVHFHWGSPLQKGSEHSINGRRYDLEMHIVHKNSKYSTIRQATAFKDGLSVIAVLFKAVKFDYIIYPGLNVLFETLDELNEFNSTAETINLISLGSLLGDINRQDFITYQGSLTTPPCSEAVTWIVFPEILPISYYELTKFWQILDKRGLPLLNNFRPTQPLENRKVYRQTTYIWTKNLIDLPPNNNIIDFDEQW